MDVCVPRQATVREDVQAFFAEESTVVGILEEHFTIDRATYQVLRKAERQTSHAIAELVRSDGFQNYTVVDCRESGKVDKTRKASYSEAGKAARGSYADDVIRQALKFNGFGRDSAFARLDRLAEERRQFKSDSKTRTGKEIRDEELGILMSICDIQDADSGKVLCARKLSVLFCEALPYATEQFDSETHVGWAKVKAEKSAAIAYFVMVLAQLERGIVNGLGLATKLTRDKKFEAGLLALANGEAEYLSLKKQIKHVQEARNRARNCRTVVNRGVRQSSWHWTCYRASWRRLA